MSASNLKVLSILFICFHVFINKNWGQFSYAQAVNQEVLPTIFSLDQFENATYGMIPEYEQLLAVCHNDIELAFSKWLQMLIALETTATQEHINIGGMKAWVRIFFDKDGSIEHFGYYLKPDSKRIDVKTLPQLLEKFIESYRFPIHANNKFTHYTTINFPIYSQQP